MASEVQTDRSILSHYAAPALAIIYSVFHICSMGTCSYSPYRAVPSTGCQRYPLPQHLWISAAIDSRATPPPSPTGAELWPKGIVKPAEALCFFCFLVHLLIMGNFHFLLKTGSCLQMGPGNWFREWGMGNPWILASAVFHTTGVP